MTILVSLLSLGLISHYFLKRGGYVEYPFLMSAIVASWLIPQMRYLERNDIYPPTGFISLSAFMLICIASTAIGYMIGKRFRFRLRTRSGNDSNAAAGSAQVSRVFKSYLPLILFTALGLIVQLLIFSLPPDQLLQRTPSGKIAILKFFADLRTISLAFSALLLFSHRSKIALVLTVANLALYFPSLFVEIKRTEWVEVAFVLIGAYWFSTHREVPKTAIIMFAPILFLIASGVVELREVSGFRLDADKGISLDLPTASEVASIDWLKVIKGEGKSAEFHAIELRNAIAYKNAIDKKDILTWGAQFWNRFVQLYVPGQFVGAEWKKSLQWGSDLYSNDFLRLNELNRQLGSTLTGFIQAYADFSYLGFIVYLIAGYIVGRTFRRASTHDAFYQIFYLTIAVVSLNIFTHDSYRLFVLLPWYYLVTTIVFRFSYKPSRA